MFKIPFKMMPASWGLKGKSRERAEAEYYFSGEELERKLVEIEGETESITNLRLLDIDLKSGKISSMEYDKERANILEEPYVNVLTTSLDKEDPRKGSIELDWNSHFVIMLADHGYTGKSDEEIIDEWFTELCKNIATDDMPIVNDEVPTEHSNVTNIGDGKKEIT